MFTLLPHSTVKDDDISPTNSYSELMGQSGGSDQKTPTTAESNWKHIMFRAQIFNVNPNPVPGKRVI